MNNTKNYGWAGTIQQFLRTDPDEVLQQLIAMLEDSENKSSQIVAWKDCLNLLYSILAQYSDLQEYIIFEYIIPRSGLSFFQFTSKILEKLKDGCGKFWV